MSTLESHSPRPVPMQVRSPPLVPFPFDSTLNLSPTFSLPLLPPQLDLDAPVPQSPTGPLPIGTPSSSSKSSVAEGVHDDVPMDDAPTDAPAGPPSNTEPGSSLRSQSSASVATAPTRRLVIRIPPPTGKIRKPLKPLPPRFTEAERRDIVRIPRLPESDDEQDGTDAASDDDESVEGF